MTRYRAIWHIQQERINQLEKWGVQKHAPVEWMAILMEEVGEVAREVTEMHFSQDGYSFYKQDSERQERYKKEIIQVAAVCVAMLESLE